MTRRAEGIELPPAAPTRGLPHPEGFRVVSTSVGSKGEAIRLLVPNNLADALFARMEQPGWASFPESRTEKEYPALLSVVDAIEPREFHLRALTATFPKVQMLPNDEVLVVASRCHRHADGSHELNARVYDAKGALQREFLLGDGINHVEADENSHIWVGYFDEGVYGNFGWGHPGGPFGAAGLACFNDRGEKLWEYQAPDGLGPISDCYALNVAADGVWAYYYTDFPFVRIDPDWSVRAWKTKSAGGRTFAVGSELVLLYGGYGEDRTACRLLRLGDKTAELMGEVSLLLPNGVELSNATVLGRKNMLHVFFADDWHTFCVDSLT